MTMLLPALMVWLSVIVLGSGCYALEAAINCTGDDGLLSFTHSEEQSDSVCSVGGDVQCVSGKQCCITCEAKNFCDIRWYKDGALVNDTCSGSLSYYGSCDQAEIISFDLQTSSSDYIGVFTCQVSNSTDTLQREFNIMAIQAPPYTGPPVENIIAPCADQQAAIGDNATFHCQFCAEEKTDELQFIWLREIDGSGNSIGEDDWVPVEELNITGTAFTSYTVLNASDGDIDADRCAGSYLLIVNVTSGAYGRYRLVALIDSTNQTNTTQPLVLYEAPADSDVTLAVLIAVFGSMAVVLFLVLMWFIFHLEVRLFLKDRFGAVEDKGQRSYDAFIAYDSSSEADCTFVLEFIRPKLMEHNYLVYVKDIDTNAGSSLAEEILEAMEISLRCILVISPSFVSSRLVGLQVNTATDQMWEQQTKIVPILFGGMNVRKIKKAGSDLAQITSVVRCLRYREGKTGKAKFLKRLLLRMPKRTRRVCVDEMSLDATTTSDRTHLTSDFVL